MARAPVCPGHLSTATEDYLRAIITLCCEDGATTTCRLAERLAVSRPSATQMVRRLCELGLVRHDPYREIVLTDAGHGAAEDIALRHGLVTQYLTRILGYSQADAFTEADNLEHALSDQLKARMAAHLGSA